MKYGLTLSLIMLALSPGIGRVEARNTEVGEAVSCDTEPMQVPREMVFVKASIRELAVKCSNTIGYNGRSMIVDPSVSDTYCYETRPRSGLGACAFLTNKLLAGNGLARVREGRQIRIVPLDAVPAGSPTDDDSW